MLLSIQTTKKYTTADVFISKHYNLDPQNYSCKNPQQNMVKERIRLKIQGRENKQKR